MPPLVSCVRNKMFLKKYAMLEEFVLNRYINLTRRTQNPKFNMAVEIQDSAAQNVVNLRCLGCELGLLNNTDGSALFSHGMYL